MGQTWNRRGKIGHKKHLLHAKHWVGISGHWGDYSLRQYWVLCDYLTKNIENMNKLSAQTNVKK